MYVVKIKTVDRSEDMLSIIRGGGSWNEVFSTKTLLYSNFHLLQYCTCPLIQYKSKVLWYTLQYIAEALNYLQYSMYRYDSILQCGTTVNSLYFHYIHQYLGTV